MIPVVVTSILCFTVLLVVGIWKTDRQEQRALVRELSAGQENTERLSQLMSGPN